MSDDLFLRACRAYNRYCARHGYLNQQPASRGSIRAHGFYLLTNCRGIVHAFRERAGRLRTIDISSVPDAVVKQLA